MKIKQSKYASYGNYKHGMKGSKFYQVWKGMKARCTNKKHNGYHNYGGKGVTICKEWEEFKPFYNDMYQSYLEHKKNNPQTTLDRIDNNGNYCKENCKWSTMREQANNLRKNVFIEHNGTIQTVANWSRELKLNYYKLHRRVVIKKMTMEEAIKNINKTK